MSNSRLCAYAYERSRQQLYAALYGSSIASILIFSCVAIVFAYWFRYWKRLPVTTKHKMWSNLGWFTFLGLAGNIAGIFSRAAFMEMNQFEYEQKRNTTVLSPQQASDLMARASTWRAVYFVVQALETPCLTISKALVLSRLIAHSTLPLQLQQRLPWHADPILLRRFGRLLIAIAITCSIIGFVANAVAAAGQSAAARLYADAAADSSRSFPTTFQSAEGINDQAEVANSVHNVSELVCLLCIICTFSAVAPMCARIMRIAERKILDSITKSKVQAQQQQASQEAALLMAQEMMERAMQTAQLQRRLIVAAACVVLVALLPRAALVALRTYTNHVNNENNECDVCGPCQTDQFLINRWYLLTPEVPIIISTISSPLPLLLCLWCMLSPSDRNRLRNNVSISDDGIERGAALARYRMHIDLPTTSLLSGGSLLAPANAVEASPSKPLLNV